MSDVDTARADVAEARLQLTSTASKLRARFSPKSLARDALSLAQKGGKGAVISAASSAKTRPLLAVGMIATGIGYLLRKPILTMIAKRLAKETRNDH
ncbi:MAG: DUF3618 domain-containing protein [Sphingomonadaceae bacterium]